MKPFLSKPYYESFQSFVLPFSQLVIEKRKQGEDFLLYNAPVAMLFHTSPYADPLDSTIAATYAMIAAEAMGLGTCMIGSVAPLLQYSKRLKNKYVIPQENKLGVMLIMGYPDVSFQRAVRRRFAAVSYN